MAYSNTYYKEHQKYHFGNTATKYELLKWCSNWARMKLKWSSNWAQMKLKWSSNETKMKLKWSSNETETKLKWSLNGRRVYCGNSVLVTCTARYLHLGIIICMHSSTGIIILSYKLQLCLHVAEIYTLFSQNNIVQYGYHF